MSDCNGERPVKIALVGATGLIGGSVIRKAIGRSNLRLMGIARCEATLPQGARMEMFVAAPEKWGEIFEATRPDVLVNALGTTWAKSGKDEQAFRKVDHELVLETARAAHSFGVDRMISISSVGANIASKAFYLRTKGEVERDLAKVGFSRLDIVRPGLLRGPRGSDRRRGERAGIFVSPLLNLFMHGSRKKYRAIDADVVASALLTLASKSTRGRYIHEYDSIVRHARNLPSLELQIA